MPDEPTHDRPRRRPLMLAMLVAGALLLAIAGSTVAGSLASDSSGGSGSGSNSSGVQQAPSAAPAQGFDHHGRHCHHGQGGGGGGGGSSQSSDSEAPPV